MVDIN
jgi:hypothetical protein